MTGQQRDIAKSMRIHRSQEPPFGERLFAMIWTRGGAVRTTLPLFIVLAGFCLSACERPVVRRTPEAMAAHRRQLAPPEHDGALEGAALSAMPARAKGVGHVTAVDRVARTITIDHDPAPGSDWPAMRLTLPVASPHLLEGVAAGALVEFHIERRAGVAEIAVLKPLSVARPGRPPVQSSPPPQATTQ
jgi:Cu/Ag efflux protein CusF